MLIFGAPVQAFSLAPAMNAYMSNIPSLKEKKVGCFVTQFFPYSWMGGKRTIGQIKKMCEFKGAEIFDFGIINWSNKNRKNMITNTINKLSYLPINKIKIDVK